MPTYVYQCNECSSKYDEQDIEKMNNNEFGENVLFETFHSMNPSDEELKNAVVCPRCNSSDCFKTFAGTSTHGYIRGYGWKDYAGARRDMNVFHLDHQDPYAAHRTPGEKDHIRSNLKKGSKFDPKTQYFTT